MLAGFVVAEDGVRREGGEERGVVECGGAQRVDESDEKRCPHRSVRPERCARAFLSEQTEGAAEAKPEVASTLLKDSGHRQLVTPADGKLPTA